VIEADTGRRARAAVLVFISDVAKVRLVVETAAARSAPWRRLSDSSAAASARRVLLLLNSLVAAAVVRVGFQIASTAAPWWLSLVMLSGWTFWRSARDWCASGRRSCFSRGTGPCGLHRGGAPSMPDSPAVEAMDNLVKRRASQFFPDATAIARLKFRSDR